MKLLTIQRLNARAVLIEFNHDVDIDQMQYDLLQEQSWLGTPCVMECSIMNDDQWLLHRGGQWATPNDDPEWIDKGWIEQVNLVYGVWWTDPENNFEWREF